MLSFPSDCGVLPYASIKILQKLLVTLVNLFVCFSAAFCFISWYFFVRMIVLFVCS